MGVLEHWSVDFYDFTVPDQLRNDPDVLRFGRLHERAARNGARHGTPVILSPSGRPNHRVNLFFREEKMAASEPGTWRRYAYTLIVWFDFLDAIGRSWDDATVRDVEAFKDWRLTDLRNEERIRATSFDTDRAGLNSFYSWASKRYGTGQHRDVPLLDQRRDRAAAQAAQHLTIIERHRDSATEDGRGIA